MLRRIAVAAVFVRLTVDDDLAVAGRRVDGEIGGGGQRDPNRAVAGVQHGMLRSACNRKAARFDAAVLGLRVQRRRRHVGQRQPPVGRLQRQVVAVNARRRYRSVVAFRIDRAAQIGEHDASVLRLDGNAAADAADFGAGAARDVDARSSRNVDFDAPLEPSELEVQAGVVGLRPHNRNAVGGPLDLELRNVETVAEKRSTRAGQIFDVHEPVGGHGDDDVRIRVGDGDDRRRSGVDGRNRFCDEIDVMERVRAAHGVDGDADDRNLDGDQHRDQRGAGHYILGPQPVKVGRSDCAEFRSGACTVGRSGSESL